MYSCTEIKHALFCCWVFFVVWFFLLFFLLSEFRKKNLSNKADLWVVNSTHFLFLQLSLNTKFQSPTNSVQTVNIWMKPSPASFAALCGHLWSHVLVCNVKKMCLLHMSKPTAHQNTILSRLFITLSLSDGLIYQTLELAGQPHSLASLPVCSPSAVAS